jgi:hypothetical protein
MKKIIKIILLLAVFCLVLISPKLTIGEEIMPIPVTAVPVNSYWQNFSADSVRGIYVTAATALNKKKIAQLIDLVDSTEINAMVIDIKDGDEVYLNSAMASVVQELIKKNIYPIAREMIFLDNGFAKRNPEYALKDKNKNLWRDRAGNLWLDPASPEVWQYNIEVAKAAIAIGFKEVQFDYVRFPSDGAVKSAVYPVWDAKIPKNEIIKSFIDLAIKDIKEFAEVPVSADIFGYTLMVKGDLGIGQHVPNLVNNFDYLSPMVYPSHYSAGNFGFSNPAAYPYEVISGTLKLGEQYFTSDNKIKIRAWIQGFNMGAVYNEKMINLEKQALYDFGLKGWLIWNPWNIYDKKSFLQ